MLVDERIVPRRSTGRKPKYPWTEWFDGAIHVVEQDVDFKPMMHSFVNILHQSARAHDGTVQTSSEGKKITFAFIPNTLNSTDGE